MIDALGASAEGSQGIGVSKEYRVQPQPQWAC